MLPPVPTTAAAAVTAVTAAVTAWGMAPTDGFLPGTSLLPLVPTIVAAAVTAVTATAVTVTAGLISPLMSLRRVGGVSTTEDPRISSSDCNRFIRNRRYAPTSKGNGVAALRLSLCSSSSSSRREEGRGWGPQCNSAPGEEKVGDEAADDSREVQPPHEPRRSQLEA